MAGPEVCPRAASVYDDTQVSDCNYCHFNYIVLLYCNGLRCGTYIVCPNHLRGTGFKKDKELLFNLLLDIILLEIIEETPIRYTTLSDAQLAGYVKIDIEINMYLRSYKDEDMINFKRGTTFKVDYEIVNS